MLEEYFVRPQTVDRIRAWWIGAEIERYVGWLAEQGYSTRSVLLGSRWCAFGEFARLAAPGGRCGSARSCRGVRRHAGRSSRWRAAGAGRQGGPRPGRADAGGDSSRLRRPRPEGRDVPSPAPCRGSSSICAERGLRPVDRGLPASPGVLRGLPGPDRGHAAGISRRRSSARSSRERSGAGLAKATVRDGCGVLRVFLRYAHRQGLLAGDLSKAWSGRRPTGCRASRDRSRGRRWGWCWAVSTAARRAASATRRSCCCW